MASTVANQIAPGIDSPMFNDWLSKELREPIIRTLPLACWDRGMHLLQKILNFVILSE